MSEITQEYLILFRTMTRVEQMLEELGASLMDAQRMAEEAYISREDP